MPVSWTAYVGPDGRAVYDLNAFVPKGSTIISDHTAIADARDAVERYKIRQEREALESAGQKELDFA